MLFYTFSDFKISQLPVLSEPTRAMMPRSFRFFIFRFAVAIPILSFILISSAVILGFALIKLNTVSFTVSF